MCKKSATHDKAVSIISKIDPMKIARVYSGRHGCACGCRGNYSEKPRQIKATLTKVRRLLAEGATAWLGEDNAGLVEFLVVDTETRTHTLHIFR